MEIIRIAFELIMVCAAILCVAFTGYTLLLMWDAWKEAQKEKEFKRSTKQG